MKGLYIHIPFCKTICSYCDFIKKEPYKNEVSRYLSALIKEIRQNKQHFSKIDTIYVGGGTPNALKVSELSSVLTELVNIDALEFTVELNPELYDEEFGKMLKNMHVNRISLGVQTFNEKHLKTLNRLHNKKIVYETVNSLRELGFDNINIDLIYGIPGQTIADVQSDLQEVISLKPTHISYYSLILENNTYLYHQHKYGKLILPDEETEAAMFAEIITYLKENDFNHYEISNFALPGFASKHNLKYWELTPYIGVGLGAFSFIDNKRIENNRILNKYILNTCYRSIEQKTESLLQDEMIFGLRKIEGINIETVNKKYQIDLFKKYPAIAEAINDGLLESVCSNLRLTEKGIFLANQVFMIFI